jgi:hypothetical protein
MVEAREKLKAKVSAADAQVSAVAKAGGLSDEAEKKIRAALFDINV